MELTVKEINVSSVEWNGDQMRFEAERTGRLFDQVEGNEFVHK